MRFHRAFVNDVDYVLGRLCAFFLVCTVGLVLADGRLEGGIVEQEVLAVVNHCLAGYLRPLAGVLGATGAVGNSNYIPVGFVAMKEAEMVVARSAFLRVAAAPLACGNYVFFRSAVGTGLDFDIGVVAVGLVVGNVGVGRYVLPQIPRIGVERHGYGEFRCGLSLYCPVAKFQRKVACGLRLAAQGASAVFAYSEDKAKLLCADEFDVRDFVGGQFEGYGIVLFHSPVGETQSELADFVFNHYSLIHTFFFESVPQRSDSPIEERFLVGRGYAGSLHGLVKSQCRLVEAAGRRALPHCHSLFSVHV